MFATSDATSPEEARLELFLNVLQRAKRARLRVVGTSMLPTFYPGDTIVVEALLPSMIQAGDIAVCIRDGRLCTHRVAKRHGPLLVTRGDANPQFDTEIPASECVGRILTIERKGAKLRRRALLSLCIRRSELAKKLFLSILSLTRTMPRRWPAIIWRKLSYRSG
jgi:signal peptidase I